MADRLEGSSCLIGIDAGTQSVRAIAFDMAGRRIAGAARPTPITPSATGGEYDPDAIFSTVVTLLAELGKALARRPVAGIAVSSVGESCVLVDEAGAAVAPAIAWFDRRTEAQAKAMGAELDPAKLFALTGVILDPTLTLFKLAWMRQNWPDAFARARRILMMADWIAFRLSGEAATDHTLASRTLYFAVHQRRWSEEQLALAGIGPGLLPPIRPSGSALGPVRPDILRESGIAGTPIVGVGGHDHLVGSLAAGITAPGTLLDSLGTAEDLLLATVAPLTDPEVAARGFFQSAVATHREISCIVGTIYPSGGAVEWVRALTGGADQATLIAEGEAVPVGSGGVAFLPHLAGGLSPKPSEHARGAFVGLTPAADRGSFYRAVLEGLALQSRLILDGMVSLPDVSPVREIRIIGGGSRNRLFVRIKANAFGRPVTVVDEAEATALGAALLGGVAAGVYRDLDQALASLDRREHVVEPDADAARYDALRTGVFENLETGLTTVNKDIGSFLQMDFAASGR